MQMASEATAAAACLSKSYMGFETGTVRNVTPRAIPIAVRTHHTPCTAGNVIFTLELSRLIAILNDFQEMDKVKKAFATAQQGDDGSGDEGGAKHHSMFNQKEKRKRDLGQASRTCTHHSDSCLVT